MNYRKLFDVGMEIYHVLVKLFYANLKEKGPKGYEFYAVNVKGVCFSLTLTTLN